MHLSTSVLHANYRLCRWNVYILSACDASINGVDQVSDMLCVRRSRWQQQRDVRQLHCDPVAALRHRVGLYRSQSIASSDVNSAMAIVIVPLQQTWHRTVADADWVFCNACSAEQSMRWPKHIRRCCPEFAACCTWLTVCRRAEVLRVCRGIGARIHAEERTSGTTYSECILHMLHRRHLIRAILFLFVDGLTNLTNWFISLPRCYILPWSGPFTILDSFLCHFVTAWR